jgi:hypothetical protein
MPSPAYVNWLITVRNPFYGTLSYHSKPEQFFAAFATLVNQTELKAFVRSLPRYSLVR